MQVVLRADIDKVGKRGDIVDVSDGYARNFLIPRGQAFKASKNVTAQATAMRSARDRADAKNREAAEGVAKNIVSKTVTIRARASAEGKLFGSVTNADIVTALKEQTGIELDRKQIEVQEHLRQVGTHAVPVKLHSEVHVALNVDIQSDGE